MLARLMGFTALASFMMAGAIAADQGSEIAKLPDVDGRGGVLETADGRYVFNPKMCAMAIEDGEHDIEIYGPGTDPDGRVIFVELSSTGRYLSVGFDIASVFESPDEGLAANDIDVVVSGTVITAQDLVLRDRNGAVVGSGALYVDCSPPA
jgi:hypothetical protein